MNIRAFRSWGFRTAILFSAAGSCLQGQGASCAQPLSQERLRTPVTVNSPFEGRARLGRGT